jgi:hypothetical protein
MWQAKLRKNYANFEEFQDYAASYGLPERLGFRTAREAWGANPLIQGSTNPEDFKIVDPETPVIFRKWKAPGEFYDGDIIALFPADPGTYDPYTCSSYAQIGQHSSADPWLVMAATKPAKPEEYAELKAELERIGYNLKIYSKNLGKFLEMRRKELAK